MLSGRRDFNYVISKLTNIEIKKKTSNPLSYISQSPEKVIFRSNKEFLSLFTAIVAVDLDVKCLEMLGSLSSEIKVSLISIIQIRGVSITSIFIQESIGILVLYAKFLKFINKIPIIIVFDLKETSQYDYCYSEPFDALLDLACSYDKVLESRTKGLSIKIPFVLVIHKSLMVWRKNYKRKMPKSQSDRDSFMEIIRDHINKYNLSAECIDEVLKNTQKMFLKPNIPSDVERIINHTCAINPPKKVTPIEHEHNVIKNKKNSFWTLASATRKFVELNGRLPNSGILPDMCAETSDYIELQRVFHEEHKKNRELISRFASVHTDDIDDSEIDTWCKYSNCLRIISRDNIYAKDKIKEYIRNNAISKDAASAFAVYLTLCSTIEYDGDFESSKKIMQSLNSNIIREKISYISLNNEFLDFALIESWINLSPQLAYSVSVITGSVASQEIIKVVSGMYIPINNTLIYDGVSGRHEMFLI